VSTLCLCSSPLYLPISASVGCRDSNSSHLFQCQGLGGEVWVLWETNCNAWFCFTVSIHYDGLQPLLLHPGMLHWCYLTVSKGFFSLPWTCNHSECLENGICIWFSFLFQF
jgi:hypothetical protein